MKKNLLIDLNTLPEEGKIFSGELDKCIFSPDRKPRKRGSEEPSASEPLFYELYVQRFDQELLVRGRLSVPIEFTCVRCLNRYINTIEIQECAISSEIETSQIDLIEPIREEIILLFPDYPRCDEGDEEKECNIDSHYLAVDKPLEDEVKTPPPNEVPNPWGALDDFDDTPTTGR